MILTNLKQIIKKHRKLKFHPNQTTKYRMNSVQQKLIYNHNDQGKRDEE